LTKRSITAWVEFSRFVTVTIIYLFILSFKLQNDTDQQTETNAIVSTHTDSAFDNHVTLTLACRPLTSGSTHTELPYTV